MNVDLSGAEWFKSSRSGGAKECVEVAFLDGGHVGVRDSKNPTGPALVFTAAEWDVFTGSTSDPGSRRGWLDRGEVSRRPEEYLTQHPRPVRGNST